MEPPLGHKASALGGVENGPDLSDLVDSYDPDTDTWTRLGVLPAPRKSAVAGAIGNSIVVSTGQGAAVTDGADTTWVAPFSF